MFTENVYLIYVSLKLEVGLFNDDSFTYYDLLLSMQPELHFIIDCKKHS